jgi:hypothetical protein
LIHLRRITRGEPESEDMSESSTGDELPENVERLIDERVEQQVEEKLSQRKTRRSRRSFLASMAAAAGVGAVGVDWIRSVEATDGSAVGQIGTPSSKVNIYAHSLGDSNNPVDEFYVDQEFVSDSQTNLAVDNISADSETEVSYNDPIGDAANPVPGTSHYTALSTERVNGDYRIRADDGEADARAVIENANYGDKIVISPGFRNVPLSSTLTIPPGVLVEHSLKQQNEEDATFIKEFDGDAIEYDDWVTLRNIRLDGNRESGYTGDGIVPVSANNRECYFVEVTSRRNDGAGLVLNETFLSKFDHCDYSYNQDGVSHRGDAHSPHTEFAHCRMAYNDRAGVDIASDTGLDRVSFNACLIDQNKYGIDTERCTAGRAITNSTTFGAGTLIQGNNGPGIILQGSDADALFLTIGGTAEISANNQDPEGTLTSTNGQGDIHSENGGRIGGTISGNIGELRRYNDDGINVNLTIGGSAGDLEIPETFVVVLNDAKVGSVSARSGIGLNPLQGGSTVNY